MNSVMALANQTVAHSRQWYVVNTLIEQLNLSGTAWATVLTVVGILLCMIVPYLLGSINFGLLISRKKYHDDVRAHGSGNAGTTNMLRTYGRKAAVLTLIGDMAKGVVAVAFGYLIIGVNAEITEIIGETPTTYVQYDQFGAAIAGLFVMLGHLFPVFYKFKGGKGVATSMAVIFMMDPWFIVPTICGSIYLILLFSTKYVSLASCITLIMYPLVLNAFSRFTDPPRNPTACALAVIMALLVVFMHRENLKRLLNGTERRVSFKKKKKNPDGTVEDATPVEGAPAEAVPTADAPAEPKPNLGNDPTARRTGNKKNKSKK